ncbi:NfeD family protein [Aquisphaera insulae]|uniref:NfeD family protein n=1 Tax=Aquisphaera insulae TaxID=2712864 RepID=UPI0013ED38D1|nr:NfeD family protein [Aquisphaera insulae]
MIRLSNARHGLAFEVIAALALATAFCPAAARAQATNAADSTPGQFFTVTEPINNDTIQHIRAATRQLVDRNAGAAKGKSPILVFEFLPGESAPGTSEFGTSFDLANLISKELGGARMTVAYVPQPLKGYAVLPAVACTEVVMGPAASLGPITPDGGAFDPAFREPVRFLALRKTRDPDLLLGMLDRDADLRIVRTTDNTLHYLLPEHLDEFRRANQVKSEEPAWEGGQRGVLSAARARAEGFSKAIVANPADVARLYRIGGQSAVEDPTLGQAIRPVWIKINGPLDSVKVGYLSRRIEQARQEKVNLVFFQIDSPGGLDMAADGIADQIAAITDMKTVAYVDDRAVGVAALLPLACRDIVFKKTGRMGDVRQILSARSNRLENLSEAQIQMLARKAAFLAGKKGHPEAIARAMVDPAADVVEATDRETGGVRLLLREEAEANRARFQGIQPRKDPGRVLTLGADDAASLGLGQVVAGEEELKGLYGLRGKPIRVDGPSWVDTLVSVLTDPYVSWLLLFVGIFMLVVELKLPGIGLPAITSALAFLLFFWSHYLSGTADQLEIILFLVGMVCLGIELFVFPGFGIFGMPGILLMLASIVMASHTFVWPTQEYEFREMGFTLVQIILALVAVGGGAVVLARYLPSIPFLNRLVLKPEPWTGIDGDDPSAKPSLDGYESLTFLIGETGRTTSPLRPTGKARFGNLLVDVTADGFYVDADSLVEVIDVQGPKVIVKPMA